MSFPPFTRAIERRMYVIGVLLVPVALFVLLSLATHAETDYPNSSRGPGEVANLGGLPGALISYGVMLALGYGGYVVPVLIGLLAWNRIRGQRALGLILQSTWLLALVVTGISTGSLIPVLPDYLRFRIGGIMGFYIGGRMAGVLGADGSLILSGALFLFVLVAMLYFGLIRRRRGVVGRRNA